jgi:hypothetical protein
MTITLNPIERERELSQKGLLRYLKAAGFLELPLSGGTTRLRFINNKHKLQLEYDLVRRSYIVTFLDNPPRRFRALRFHAVIIHIERLLEEVEEMRSKEAARGVEKGAIDGARN